MWMLVVRTLYHICVEDWQGVACKLQSAQHLHADA